MAPLPGAGGGRRGRRGGEYNDIPDDNSHDSYGDGGNNPFAASNATNSNGNDRKPPAATAAIRAGGATPLRRVPYDDDDMFDDDDHVHDEEYDYERNGRRRRNPPGSSSSSPTAGHRKMKVQTLSTLHGSNAYSGSMAKCWLYVGLVMLVVMGVLLGLLKESRLDRQHQIADGAEGTGIGVEGYARPAVEDDDDADDDDDDADDADGRGFHYGTAASAQGEKDHQQQSGGGGSGVSPHPVVRKKGPHHRDPAASLRSHDPFHLVDASWYGSVFAPPPFPAFADATGGNDDGNGNGNGNDDDDEDDDEDRFDHQGRGYFQYPSVHNSTLVFCSEGDLYLTRLPDDIIVQGSKSRSKPIPPIPSVKLTTTVGNVLTPHINPVYPYLVAYTATYTGTREAYLLDLRPSSRGLLGGGGPAGPAMRLTYFDGVYGVERVVGWADDGTTLIVATMHDEIAMEDVRLYKVGIVQNGEENGGSGGGGRRTGTGSGTGTGSRWAKSRQDSPVTVSSVQPIPLHQAIDGVIHRSSAVNDDSSCMFFTRFKQSSQTFRYVGGTAEHLWAYCDGEDRAVALTGDYRGTSRSPAIYRVEESSEVDGDSSMYYLLFISDRHDGGDGTWIPGTLNLWAVPLPTQKELYSTAYSEADGEAGHMPKKMSRPFQLTLVNCEHNGMSLMEYSVDEVQNNLILRIGADLHFVDKGEVVKLLKKGGRRLHNVDEGGDDDNDHGVVTQGEDSSTTNAATENVAKNDGKVNKGKKKKRKKDNDDVSQRDGTDDGPPLSSAAVPKGTTTSTLTSSLAARVLPISIMSDLQNLHERLLPITHPTFVQLLDNIDAYKTPYGTLSALVTIRGQAWINPVIPDLDSFYKYEGGGMNMPPRRYRVAPGSTTGGMTRVMLAVQVPQPDEYTRTSLILATDPLSTTAELAFYLVETLADSTPAFADISHLPKPILGGHLNGGSVRHGGLGSIKVGSLTVSPCGRRVAWTDTDGRICAMALPNLGDYWSTNETDLQEAAPLEYTVMPQENESGQPMVGIEAELRWSPGGRYLAIEHAARNQFVIISIADLGEISAKDTNNMTTNDDEDEGDKDGEEEDDTKDDWNINVGRVVQATIDRFNSVDAYWGRTAFDMATDDAAGEAGSSQVLPTATTLYYLTDRDVVLSGVSSPWGTRAPSPHFEKNKCVYALPLAVDQAETNDARKVFGGPFAGGGASELAMLRESVLEEIEEAKEEAANEDTKKLKDDGSDADKEEGEEISDRRRTKAKVIATSEPTAPPPSSAKAKKGTEDGKDNEGELKDDEAREEPANEAPAVPIYPVDVDISFGSKADSSFLFARRAYRMSNIPKASYIGIVSQLKDDPALILLEKGESGSTLVKVFSIDDFPSDGVDSMPIEPKVPGMTVVAGGISTSRHHLYFIYKMPGKVRTKIVGNDAASLISLLVKDDMFTKNIVDNSAWALSIWPSLEYQQMYSDAWRLLRDYFYDAGMTSIDWDEVYKRYLPLVGRCAKREELDDVLRQMASELSALHVFVYGGEYSAPLHDDDSLELANEVASLGAAVRKSDEWAGYVVMSLPERDPDFNLMDGKAIYSPLSHNVLKMSGQRGLEVGDVIIGVNGESVINVPSIHMLLRGMAGKAVRLEVLRVKSGPSPLLSHSRRVRTVSRRVAEGGDDAVNDDAGDTEDNDYATPEPLIVVPLSPSEASNLRYTAWEWRTRQAVKQLSAQAGFTAGYIHLRDMSGTTAEDAFVRGFYPDYDKQALIVDVRHNHGGNIDSWLLDVLQRRAWMYWQGRATNITNGGLGWDEQFAFRGHIIVLIDEKTSSDGEGFSRGISELGLGKLVGTRTWGGGIWLSSDNKLVDGGIASAPEIGTYNKNFGWGLGIENMGVDPDVWVDNDPHETYGGRDAQLDKAISVLKEWLEEEPVVLPQRPGRHRDMSLRAEAESCGAK